MPLASLALKAAGSFFSRSAAAVMSVLRDNVFKMEAAS
jgi:hypothetical protein